ncbi:MAG: glycosyltransferase family 2 protein [Spartobacteria bacterium]
MSFRPLVVLPTFNSGSRLARTLREAHAEHSDVWVVVDGSTDGSDLEAEALGLTGVSFLRLTKNSGKGGAVLEALREASREGFTHLLAMDADGQHPAESIHPFLETAKKNPGAFLCGVPVFGPDAPPERVKGRIVGNSIARLETLGLGARDSLCGFRLSPVEPALAVIEGTRWGRRFDFDTVLAVRLSWAGLRCINIPVPVTYPPRAEGGVTHFRYMRDNLLLIAAHSRLLVEWPLRLPGLIRRRVQAGLRISQ